MNKKRLQHTLDFCRGIEIAISYGRSLQHGHACSATNSAQHGCNDVFHNGEGNNPPWGFLCFFHSQRIKSVLYSARALKHGHTLLWS